MQENGPANVEPREPDEEEVEADKVDETGDAEQKDFAARTAVKRNHITVPKRPELLPSDDEDAEVLSETMMMHSCRTGKESMLMISTRILS